jgi:hypothetical protein
MKFYYNYPTQVLFRCKTDDIYEEEWLAGIAYCDEVICGCCGAVISCEDIEFIEELKWVEIHREIGGDELLDKMS